MTPAHAPYAALIFIGADAVDLSPFRKLAEQALADHDEFGEYRKPASDNPDIIAGTTCYVRLAAYDDFNPRTGKASGLKLTITATPYGNTPTDVEKLHGILMNIVSRGFRKTDADMVEWLAPHALLDRDEFLEVSYYVSKKRSSRHNAARLHAAERTDVVSDLGTDLVDRLNHEMDDKLDTDLRSLLDNREIDGWDPAETNLARMFRANASEAEIVVAEKERDEQLSAQMRLASWALTGTVATISLPVAVSLSIVSVAKGEDFRLNTQVLAITGLMGALSVNGMLNLGGLLGV